MIVVQRYDNGPVRAVLTANQAWLDLMRSSERNALLRRCALRALYDWRRTRLIQRFTPVVNHAPYNYANASRSPLVKTGEMRNEVLNESRGETRAKRNGAGTQQVTAVLRTHYGHIVGSEIARVMKVMPPSDTQFFADRFAVYVATEQGQTVITQAGKVITGSVVGAQPKGKLRVALNTGQRRRLGVKTRKKGLRHG